MSAEEPIVGKITNLLQLHLHTNDTLLEPKINSLLASLKPHHPDSYTRLQATFRSQILSHAEQSAFLRQRPARSTAVKTSDEITNTLRHALEISERETERSRDLAMSLDESTKMAQKTGGEYNAMGEHLQTSNKVLKNLANKDQKDRMLLMLGIGVFTLTVMWIVYKRFWIPFM
jgi:Sec20